MTQITDTDIQQIKDLITAGSAATHQQISNLREEMRVGFANVDTKLAKLDGKIDKVESKLEGKIDKVESKLEGKIDTIGSRLSNLESTAAKLPDLAEKVGELKNWKQIAIVIFTASVSGAIAWFVHR